MNTMAAEVCGAAKNAYVKLSQLITIPEVGHISVYIVQKQTHICNTIKGSKAPA
jgi:hypothetical protein